MDMPLEKQLFRLIGELDSCPQKINGAPEGSRTPGTRIRSPLLYPTELQAHVMERVEGIEPSRSAWKAEVLPLNYTRILNYRK